MRLETIILSLVALTAFGCFSPGARVVSVRAITVRVVDARTSQPIPHLPVSYALQTIVTRGKFLGIVPSIEPDIGAKLAFKARGLTNGAGEVSFQMRELQLPGNERVDQEFVFVNVEADMSRQLSQTVVDTLEAACKAGAPTCGGQANAIDVAWSAKLSSRTDRMEVFRNPDARYTGTLLIVVPGAAHAGRSDWTEPDDTFRVQTHFSHRKEAEVFTVGLDHRLGP